MALDLLSSDESGLAKIPTSVLIAALTELDPEVQACAIYALGSRPTPDSIAALVTCLAGPSAFLARTAADALQHIGKPAVPALLEALTQSNGQTRGLAARALAQIKDTATIPALFKVLEDESAAVRYWADEALERMGVGQVYFKP